MFLSSWIVKIFLLWLKAESNAGRLSYLNQSIQNYISNVHGFPEFPEISIHGWLSQKFRSCFFLKEFSAKSIIYRDFTEIWDSFITRQSSLLQLIRYGIGLNVVLHLLLFLIIFDHQTESNWHRPRPKKIKKTNKNLSWSISVADLFQEHLRLALQQQKLTDNFARAKDAC